MKRMDCIFVFRISFQITITKTVCKPEADCVLSIWGGCFRRGRGRLACGRTAKSFSGWIDRPDREVDESWTLKQRLWCRDRSEKIKSLLAFKICVNARSLFAVTIEFWFEAFAITIEFWFEMWALIKNVEVFESISLCEVWSFPCQQIKFQI
jgi:hypothetical protein